MKYKLNVELDPDTQSIKCTKTVTYEGDARVHSVYYPGVDAALFDKLMIINQELNNGIRRFEDAERKKM